MSTEKNDIVSELPSVANMRLRQENWGVFVTGINNETSYIIDVATLSVLKAPCCCNECVSPNTMAEIIKQCEEAKIFQVYASGARHSSWIHTNVKIKELRDFVASSAARFRFVALQHVPDVDIKFDTANEMVAWYFTHSDVLFSRHDGSGRLSPNYREVLKWLVLLEQTGSPCGFRSARFLQRLENQISVSAESDEEKSRIAHAVCAKIVC